MPRGNTSRSKSGSPRSPRPRRGSKRRASASPKRRSPKRSSSPGYRGAKRSTRHTPQEEEADDSAPASPSPRSASRTPRAEGKGLTSKQLKSVSVQNEEAALDLMQKFEDMGMDSAPGDAATNDATDVSMTTVEGVSMPLSMAELIAYVSDSRFKESWRIVCWTHVTYKLGMYTGAYLSSLREVNACRERLNEKADAMGAPQDDRWKILSDDSELSNLMDISAQFKVLSDHCRLKARNLEANASVSTLHTGDKPIAARVSDLRELLRRFSRKAMQHEIVDFVARILLAFFQNPYFARNKFFSFLFVGPPGTGKTTIAKDIADVLVASGLFEGGFADKGKPDFIGQYLGQTPHISKKTLITYALEGVLFIDEAYSLCNLDDKTGKVDMYGGEFATALVDFMTRFKGLGCVIAAGYEPEMKAQFLAANDGLPRRFPHRFLLKSLDTNQLTSIVDNFSSSVLRPAHEEGRESSLSADASELLRSFIERARRGKGGASSRIAKMLENQAGSASNIAEFISIEVGSKRKKDGYFKARQGVVSEDAVRQKVDTDNVVVTKEDIMEALKSIILQGEMSSKGVALREFASLFSSR